VGIWESALILLGIGIVSEKFGAGVGLQELGTGIRTLAAAPLGGVGSGLGEFSGGLRSFAEALGDIGRGFGELFKSVPGGPALPSPNGDEHYSVTPGGNGGLIQVSGGDKTSDLAGGGGSVPNGRIMTLGTDIGPITGTYSQISQFYITRGFTPEQVHSLVDPHFLEAGSIV
jgi:hypothetical protein